MERRVNKKMSDGKKTGDLSWGERAGQNQLEDIINRSPAVAFLWRAIEGWPVEFVSANVSQFGYTAEEFMSGAVPYTSIIYPEDVKRVGDEVSRYSKEGLTKFTREYRILTRSKEVRWIEDVTQVRRNSDGVITHYQGIITDVTERRWIEEELREERSRAQKYLDVCGVMVVAVNTEQEVTLINRRGCEILGYEETDIIGKNWFDNFIPERFRDETKHVFNKVVAGEIGSSKYHVNPVVTSRGEERTIAWHNTLITDNKGKVLSSLSSGEDITEREQWEEQLKLEAQILDSATDSIFLRDLDGNIIYANEVAYKSRGYSLEECLAMNIHQMVAPGHSDKVEHNAEVLLGSGEDIFESVDIRKDGSTFPSEIHRRLIEAGGRKLVISVSRDITERKKAEEALRISEEKYRLLVENINEVIYTTDTKGVITYISPAIKQLTGYEPGECLGELFTRFINPDDVPMVFKHFTMKLVGDKPRPMECRVFSKDGKILNIRIYSQPIIENSNPVGVAGTLVDITERKRAEQALKESEEKYKTLADNSLTGIFIHQDDKYVYVNDRFAEMHGYTTEEILDMDYLDLNHPDEREVVKGIVGRRIAGESLSMPFVRQRLKKDGQSFWAELRSSTIEYMGKPAIIGNIIDITERKKLEEYVSQLAYHDPLTGLPNRSLLTDRFKLALAHARRYQHVLAVMMLDIDRFKDVNDTLGHDAGDKLLKEVANRLADVMRKTDTVSRMGGDEFVLLLSEASNADDAVSVAQKIFETIRQPFTLDGHELKITASIGIAFYPEDGDDIENLLRHADSAMYSVKQKGRNGYLRYTREMDIKPQR